MNHDSTEKLFRTIGLAFAGIGLLMLVCTWFSYRHTASFLSAALPATGEVIENYHRSSGGKTTCFPVIAFMTRDERRVEFTSDVGSGLCEHAVGAKLPVLYSAADPSQARENSFITLWLMTFIFGAIGVGFTAMGMLGWWMNRPPQRYAAASPKSSARRASR